METIKKIAILDAFYSSICSFRSMRNMTEDEENEYKSTCTQINGINFENLQTFDWFDKHHFDYRDLIEKGLALEAPEGIY